MIDPLFDWTKPQQIAFDGVTVTLRPMARPHCYNRPVRGEWIYTGRTSGLVKRELWPGDGFLAGPEDRMTFVQRPVLRWKWPWFVDRCAAWDSGPSPISESVPARERWRCEGCCWLPEKAARYMAQMRPEIQAMLKAAIMKMKEPSIIDIVTAMNGDFGETINFDLGVQRD